MRQPYALLAALVPFSSGAQQSDEIPPEMAPFVRIVRGAETPSLISKAEYIKHFVGALPGVIVDDPHDAEILAAFKGEFEQLQETTKTRVTLRAEQACQAVATGAMQPTDFFLGEAEAERADDLTRIELYDQAMSRLSGRGRAAVQRFLNATLLPSMTTVTIDHAGIALQYPEKTAIIFQSMCASRAPH
jgi:hypothetical protein